jgi:transcriptional regulator with XRE-family HTH domain
MGVDADNLKRHFGLRIRELRGKLGYSQEELAHLSGLDRSYVSEVERGVRNISLVNIGRLADALGVSLSDLFSFPLS